MTTKLGVRMREIMRVRPQGPPPAVLRPEVGDFDEGTAGASFEEAPFPRAVAPSVHATASPDAMTPQSIGRRLAQAAARALGGSVHDTGDGPCVVVERFYDHTHLHGLLRIGTSACHVHHDAPGLSMLAGASWRDTAAGERPGPAGCPASIGQRRGDILFLDLETTGLAGGAGTYAFLVGCGWFEPDGFRVRQYFMVGHALERALLSAVRERLESCGPLVTYNGKSFDVPVLETRFVFNRQRAPLGDRPHVDMLHPARRLWRGARPLVSIPGAQRESCTLSALERALFGVQRTRDVPGFEIPARYFAFLRSGDASPLDPVLEHNRLDLVSLAALTGRAFRLLAEERPTVDGPRECLGVARLLERAAVWDRAEDCYRRAIDLASRSWQAEDDEVRVEALHALALRCRRTARYLDAAAHWETLARARRCPPALLREALEALAIHHEHRSRDLDLARRFAEQTRRVTGAHPRIDGRLARIDRKIGKGGAPAPITRNAWLWG
jgi:uncharacterized protein YprB with RNaseH-like and TPR domain